MTRKLILGTYDTAAHGWTLSAWKFADPEQEQHFVKIPGSSVTLDMSTALTDGVPTYQSRPFEATLECSEGTREDRLALVDEMMNSLDGVRVNITLPDDSAHYITGRLSIRENYNDPDHASVTVKAVCDPWRYSTTERASSTFTASSTEATSPIKNQGKRPVNPTIIITGTVTLQYAIDSKGSQQTRALSAGTYVFPDLVIKGGATKYITFSGSGTLAWKFREAKL